MDTTTHRTITRNTPKTSTKGFSLVELMVVVALIAIMALFAAPEMMNFRPNMELNGAARELYGSFQNCKLAAVRHNTRCAITFNQVVGAETFSYYVFLDADNDFAPGATETVIGSTQFADLKTVTYNTAQGGSDSVLDGITLPGNAIAFQSNGLPITPGGIALGATNGTVHLTNTKSKTASVVVNQVGNISIR